MERSKSHLLSIPLIINKKCSDWFQICSFYVCSCSKEKPDRREKQEIQVSIVNSVYFSLCAFLVSFRICKKRLSFSFLSRFVAKLNSTQDLNCSNLEVVHYEPLTSNWAVEYWIVSNETNTDVCMYTWKIYFYTDLVTLLYMDEVR